MNTVGCAAHLGISIGDRKVHKGHRSLDGSGQLIAKISKLCVVR